VFVLFPDPWPKKRHTKNRILQAALLDALATRMEPGGCLHFRTDHADTFAWGMAVIAGHADWEIRDDAEWPFEAPSYFQELLGDYQSLTAERL
jgi:tRNA (guanine-N7-)-methyltransferase